MDKEYLARKEKATKLMTDMLDLFCLASLDDNTRSALCLTLITFFAKTVRDLDPENGAALAVSAATPEYKKVLSAMLTALGDEKA